MNNGRKHDRVEQPVRLVRLPGMLRDGLSKAEIARQLGTSRQTIYDDLKLIQRRHDRQEAEAIGPLPEDMELLYQEGVTALRTAAANGSAVAATRLAELAKRALDAKACEGHIEQSEAQALFTAMWNTTREGIRRWPRGVALRLGWDGEMVAAVEEELLDEMERIRAALLIWHNADLGDGDGPSAEEIFGYVRERLEDELEERRNGSA